MSRMIGTTACRLTNFIDPLFDLVSVSGDEGLPIAFIRGYFDNNAKD